MGDIKLRIAFDPTDMWNHDDFRELIRNFAYGNSESTNQVDLYLITTNTDTDFITNVVTESGMDSTKAFQVSGNAAVVSKLQAENVNIYLTTNEQLISLVNLTNPLTLVTNNTTGCQAIIMNNIFDTYKLQQKYVTMLQFWIAQILKYEG